MRSLLTLSLAVTGVLIPSVSGIALDIDNEASIKAAARTAAHGLMSYYKNNKTTTKPQDYGTIDKPIYWWEAGAMWGAMIDYWSYVGDESYVETTSKALVANFGPNNDVQPAWRNGEMGNDDQAFWALALMSAVEQKFPDPQNAYRWIDVAARAFDNQASRWDTAGCHGGLRWQVFKENKGYDYMNSISNGGFFQLAARLARYTGNQTYVEWAEKAWEWTVKVGLIDSAYSVFDGTDSLKGCSDVNGMRWSYNVAIYLHGAATMFNITNGDQKWKDRTEGLVGAAGVWFGMQNATDIMHEVACEPYNTCNTDQLSFKAYLSRWMAKTTVMAPFTKPTVERLLKASAKAAAATCTGGDGNACGSKWYTGGFAGPTGVGQQMSALEVIQSLLVSQAPVPAVEHAKGTEPDAPATAAVVGEALVVKSSVARRNTVVSKASRGRVCASALVPIVLLSMGLAL